MELAHDYAYEAALIDLRDLHRDTRDGLHMASLAGAWMTMVVGFGGLRDDEGILALDPLLPDGISRLRFRLRWRDFRLAVDVNHTKVTYTVHDGPEHELSSPCSTGEALALNTRFADDRRGARPASRCCPTPQQPPGRDQCTGALWPAVSEA